MTKAPPPVRHPGKLITLPARHHVTGRSTKVTYSSACPHLGVMPRKRPAELRLDDAVLRSLRTQREQMSGISDRGTILLARLEIQRHRGPGATASALRRYTRLLNDPAHRLWDDQYGCGIPECCASPSDLREWLEVAIRHLPPRDRRALERRLHELDSSW